MTLILSGRYLVHFDIGRIIIKELMHDPIFLAGKSEVKEKYNDMTLETERLILRPFTESDAADAYEYLHEPMVHCFACMKTETMDDARKAVLDRAKDGEY